MAQTQQAMGSSPLAGNLMQQLQGPAGGAVPPQMAQNWSQLLAQGGTKNPNAPQPNYSNMPGMTQGPASLGGGWTPMGTPTPQSSTGMQTPPGLRPPPNFGSIGGMQPGRMPMGAPGQGAGGGKAGPQAQQIKQQTAGLRGAPGQGAGGAKGGAQQQMKQQMATLPGAPR
jgi:hypothetical protein